QGGRHRRRPLDGRARRGDDHRRRGLPRGHGLRARRGDERDRRSRRDGGWQAMSILDRIMTHELPELDGATAWVNSEPLSSAGLRGRVVIVQFCTYSCVNWLRTLPYVRAWVERYADDGLVVIGAHSPEFPFEHDVEQVRPALEGLGVHYPIAIDNEF